MVRRPEPGDLLHIDGRASVQFAGDRALTFRVVSVCDRPTYAGWIWLTGYVINRRGNATIRREIYVQLAGLHPAPGNTAHRSVRPPPASSYAARHDQNRAAAEDRPRLRARADAG